jgi:tetratricopeptide (TPR) repeat protein
MMRFLFIAGLLIVSIVNYSQEASDYLLRAKALSDRGKNKDAIELLTGALVKIQDSRFYLLRADVYAAIGSYSEAIADYQSANNVYAYSGEYGLARMYALKNDVKTALYHLDLSISSPFRKNEKEIMLDPAYSLIENTPEWRLFWKKERYSISEQKISEIEYYITTGNKEESAHILSELTTEYPDSPSTLYAKALVDFSMLKYSETLTILDKLISGEGKKENYLRLLGKAQMASGNPSGASVTYTTLLNLGLADAGLLISRAECYRKTGEDSKAMIDISKYLELYPDNREALKLAGKIEVESGDNLKALDYFSINLKLHPNDPECYTDRANSYFSAKSWESAISDYSMSLDIQPANSDVWLNKGVALLNIGKTDDACHDFRKSLALGNKKATPYISRYCIK